MSSDDEDSFPTPKRLKRSKSKLNIADLPEDVLISIFQYLDFLTLTQCSGLCKKFWEVYNDPKLYTEVYLKYDMDCQYMTAYLNKVIYPKRMHIEYKKYDSESPLENYSEFNDYVTWLVKKCSSTIIDFTIENCQNDYILMLVCECRILNRIKCVKCKGNFDALPTLKHLKSIYMTSCDITTRILNETLENNGDLIKLNLEDNIKVSLTEISVHLAKHNKSLQQLSISDIKKIRMKGLRKLCQCSSLQDIELSSSLFSCDPEDAIELIAAGCKFLKRLSIKGWSNINDTSLMPIIHFSLQMRTLEFYNLNVTIKICREAALSLPFLEDFAIYHCKNITKNQLVKLQTDFDNINVRYSL